MPDETQIKCPHCGQSYAVLPEQWAQYHGRTINCTKCGQSFTVTAPQSMISPPPAPQYPPEQPAAFTDATGATAGSAAAPPVPYGTYQNQGFAVTPTEKNGLALTSFIFGFVGFCIPVLGGITAIITGIVALAKTRDPRVGGRGMAIAGISLGGVSILVTPVLAIMISIMLPALNRAREQANRVKCASEMKQIGLALAQYENSNQLQFPPDLKTLEIAANLPATVFVCPSSNDTPAPGTTAQAIAANLVPGHLSYVYVGDGLTASASADDVVLYEQMSNHLNEGTNVLFGDFHVEWMKSADVQSILSQQAAGKRPIRLTTSP